MLVTIEWPVLIFAAIGAVALWRRWPIFAAFLLWDFFVSLAVYSWAGEKFAWLVLHPLLPAHHPRRRGHRGDRADARASCAGSGIAGVAVGLFYLGLSSWWVNVDRGTDPREMLVSTQSSSEVKDVADQVLALAESRGPGAPPLSVTVDSAEGATFPYAWYFRHLQTGYIDLQQANAAVPTTDAIVMTDNSRARLQPQLGNYDCRVFDFRVWWVREYGKLWGFSPANWLDYVTQREVWNPTGGMKESLCVKKGL